jgi:hypothetical protein
MADLAMTFLRDRLEVMSIVKRPGDINHSAGGMRPRFDFLPWLPQ